MSKTTGNLYRNTSFRNGGRKAGAGVDYDDYSEESMGHSLGDHWEPARFPHDGENPEELNGPVLVYRAGDDLADMDYYELRLCGVVKCCGTIPMLGYPPEQLRQMLRDGYRLYRNGKQVKVSELEEMYG